MQNSKIIFVTGATGNQGGAVVRNLITDGFRVKALTRNDSSGKAEALKKSGAEVIKGELNDMNSIADHLKGVDGIFCVLASDRKDKQEIGQGIALTNLAKQLGIGHFLYSSVVGADLDTGIPNWESKFKIENHIKEIGLQISAYDRR